MIFITSRFRVISVVGLIAVIFYDLNYDIELLILMLKFSIIGRRCRRRCRSVAVRLKIHYLYYIFLFFQRIPGTGKQEQFGCICAHVQVQ